MLERAEIDDYNERVKEIRENMGRYRQLGYVPAFKELQTHLQERGYKACSSLICDCPVQLMTSGFYKDDQTADGLTAKCKRCNNNPAAHAAAEKRKREARVDMEAKGVKVSNSETETEAVNNCLVPLLTEAGMECLVTPEFRRADMAARRDSWTDVEDAYLQVQVKADGVYRDDGVTPKPNNTSLYKYGGGVAQFGHCMGYEHMAMIFVKSRLDNDDGGNVHRKIWVMNGSDVKKEQMAENVDGTLGPNKFKPLPAGTATEVGEALDKLVLESKKPLVSLEFICMDMERKTQRSEMLLMLACKV